MKANVDKVGINKLKRLCLNVPSGLNNLLKVEHVNVDKLIVFPLNFKRLNNVVSKKVVENTKINKPNSKAYNL